MSDKLSSVSVILQTATCNNDKNSDSEAKRLVARLTSRVFLFFFGILFNVMKAKEETGVQQK